MSTPAPIDSGSKCEAPPRVQFVKGAGDLPMLRIETAVSSAEIYLLGAQVTHFQRKGDAPLLFLSQASRFAEGQAIRGGIPIILPWFGAREGSPAHGVARARPWEVREVAATADGGLRVCFHLDCPNVPGFAPFSADYAVTVGDALGLELLVANQSTNQELAYEDCLHTYFAAGDIMTMSVAGLKQVDYLDKVEGFARKTETAEAIKISSEVDRVYLRTKSAVAILDPALKRKILVEKENSASTVLWNPWIAKSQAMSDFGNEEYRKMVCVESGNVGTDKVTLAPGKSSALKVRLSSLPL